MYSPINGEFKFFSTAFLSQQLYVSLRNDSSIGGHRDNRILFSDNLLDIQKDHSNSIYSFKDFDSFDVSDLFESTPHHKPLFYEPPETSNSERQLQNIAPLLIDSDLGISLVMSDSYFSSDRPVNAVPISRMYKSHNFLNLLADRRNSQHSEARGNFHLSHEKGVFLSKSFLPNCQFSASFFVPAIKDSSESKTSHQTFSSVLMGELVSSECSRSFNISAISVQSQVT